MKQRVILVLVLFHSITYSWSIPCKSCEDEISYLLKIGSAVFKKIEPLTFKNQLGCVKLVISGFSTIKNNMNSCILESKNASDCFFQKLEISFDQLNITCFTNREQLMKSSPSLYRLRNPLSKLLDIVVDNVLLKFVQRNVSWRKLVLIVRMSVCFANNKFSIDTLDIQDREKDDLKVWCDGQSMIGKLCAFFTQINFIRSLLGNLADNLRDKIRNAILTSTPMKTYLATLNCRNGTVLPSFEDAVAQITEIFSKNVQ